MCIYILGGIWDVRVYGFGDDGGTFPSFVPSEQFNSWHRQLRSLLIFFDKIGSVNKRDREERKGKHFLFPSNFQQNRDHLLRRCNSIINYLFQHTVAKYFLLMNKCIMISCWRKNMLKLSPSFIACCSIKKIVWEQGNQDSHLKIGFFFELNKEKYKIGWRKWSYLVYKVSNEIFIYFPKNSLSDQWW